MTSKDPLKKFGPIWGASGSQGFFGEGYSYHNLFKYFGLNLEGSTFTAKTSTLFLNKGNMPMRGDRITPKHYLPRCIYVSPRSWWYGSALNAVSLSGPGIQFLIDKREWQKRIKPFFISIMSVKNDVNARRTEILGFRSIIAQMLRGYPHLKDVLGLQINYSCPNTGHDMEAMLKELVEEAKDHLQILSTLGIPLVPKINILLPVAKAIEIGDDPNCAGLTLSNTIFWDDLPKLGIDRGKIFGKKYAEDSPLSKRGFSPGGYSGRELLPRVVKYVEALRQAGFQKHVNAGGGILKPNDIDCLERAGANSYSLGSVSFLRPWNTHPIISRAYELASNYS